jgi:hypothetical protein
MLIYLFIDRSIRPVEPVFKEALLAKHVLKSKRVPRFLEGLMPDDILERPLLEKRDIFKTFASPK